MTTTAPLNLGSAPKTAPPPPLPDNGDTYVWESVSAPKIVRPAHNDKPQRDPVPPPPPELHQHHRTPWSRTWRIFVAGTLMGVATVKAAELLLHPPRKSSKN